MTDLSITHSQQVFVSDITYIKTEQGHAYLVIVTDAHSRKTIGWSLQNNRKVSMVKKALNRAYKNCVFKHRNSIHHSYKDIQYCCPDYSQYAEKKALY